MTVDVDAAGTAAATEQAPPDTDDVDEAGGQQPPAPQHANTVRAAMILGVAVIVALSAMVGWLGTQYYQTHREQARHALLLAGARQGALNLTSIDHTHVDADIQRIVDSSTGQFRDDFQQRAEPFAEVVRAAQSTSEGTVTSAALESVTGDDAQALVTVTVKTTSAGPPEQQPRLWRMRIDVHDDGGTVRMSNVQFVP